jgi:multidrug efflux pump
MFTTPVIYLWFDRLALRFAGRPGAGPASEMH